MADRVSQAQVYQLFRVFCNTLGLRIATSYDDHGAYAIDKYMGYRIERISDTSTGTAAVFGERRYSAREFMNVMNFTLNVVDRLGISRDRFIRNAPHRRRSARRGYVGFDR